MFGSKPAPATAQALEDRHTYIPPHIESALANHVQQSMPAHLQKYRGGNTYIPEHSQNEMTQHLENTLPGHMKQYAGAYMQQRVVQQNQIRSGVGAPEPATPAVVPHAPVIQPSIGVPVQAPQPGQTPTVSGPVPPSFPAQAGPAPEQSPDQPYAFITNPTEPPKPSPLASLPGGNSIFTRIGLVAGGLVILFILFTVLKGLLTGGPDMTPFVTIAQQQQELIHLAENAQQPQQQSNLSTTNTNLAATVQLSLNTSQANTIQYLANNHKKINKKQLNLKVSATTDSRLTDAATAGNYNQVFAEIMQTQLKAYGDTLTQAYKQGYGTKGTALLKDDYRQLVLFQTQLNSPAN